MAQAFGWVLVAAIAYHAGLGAVEAARAARDGHPGHAAVLALIALVAAAIVALAVAGALRTSARARKRR